jgi:hypothetical protein
LSLLVYGYFEFVETNLFSGAMALFESINYGIRTERRARDNKSSGVRDEKKTTRACDDMGFRFMKLEDEYAKKKNFEAVTFC